MSTDDSFPNASLSGPLIALSSQNDSALPLHGSVELDTTLAIPPFRGRGSRGPIDGDFDLNITDFPFTKLEDPLDDATISYGSQFDFLKPELASVSDATSTDGDVKRISASLPNWHANQDLMSVVLGEDSIASSFDIRLDDDLYLAANKETQQNIFPVMRILLSS
jgi:hypothetical protein